MKYLFVRQIDFVNVHYVEIMNSSECHVVLGWLIQNLFLSPNPTAFAATFSPKEKALSRNAFQAFPRGGEGGKTQS